MVAYSFKRQFVAPIRALNKAQTIRADRKRHARIGETLQLYSGMRTKSCMLIGTAKCSGVFPVRIDFQKYIVDVNGCTIASLFLLNSLNKFAVDDGFNDWFELCAFWAKEHGAIAAWSGVLIRWTDFKLPEGAR